LKDRFDAVHAFDEIANGFRSAESAASRQR
jgi:hypothetical protein